MVITGEFISHMDFKSVLAVFENKNLSVCLIGHGLFLYMDSGVLENVEFCFLFFC